MKPPNISAVVETGTANSTVPPDKTYPIGAIIAPTKNAARHDQSDENGGIRPDKIPVIPATRPRTAINKTADIPIKTPPPKEAHGVNSVE